MPLSDHYEIIKIIHVASVVVSGGYFTLRGLLMLAGSSMINRVWVRVSAPVIDTVLLASAILLVIITEQYPFVHHWLTVKLAALLIYIILGVYALRKGKTLKIRLFCFIAALLVFFYIVAVALAQNPLAYL